jgi:hypothetical protein
MKYFNFLLENEIGFTRDENGYYVALVKVLNPAFYGTDQAQAQGCLHIKGPTTNWNEQEGSDGKPRSSSQANQRGLKSAGGANKNQPVRSKSPTNTKGNFENNKKNVKNNYKIILDPFTKLRYIVQ